jgi:type IV pilus assembly protein PilA
MNGDAAFHARIACRWGERSTEVFMAQALHCHVFVSPKRQRGFTLIEMMVVVVIVGILATLAVVGYRKLVQSSHLSEATNMVQSIRVAQEAYHSETQQYADISNDLSSSWYPDPSGNPNGTPDGKHVIAWGGACPNCAQPWSVLPVHVDGPVMFGYATKAGPAGSSPAALPPDISGKFNLASVTPSPTEWYMVTAMCDLDANGSPYTYVVTTSWLNQVFTFNDGQ